jgi:hypothetical protein
MKYVPRYHAPAAKSAAVNPSVQEHAAILHVGKGWIVLHHSRHTAEWVIAVAKKAAPLRSSDRFRRRRFGSKLCEYRIRRWYLDPLYPRTVYEQIKSFEEVPK